MPTGDELARFAAVVAARFGLRVELPRSGEVLARRAAVHGATIARYLEQLDAGARAELLALASELTVSETYFLRHGEQLRALAEVVVPDRLAHGRLHVLSAGCASGEEPYTLAMVLHDACPGTPFAIHAIDLDPQAIARARAGRYSRWSLRATTPALERRWFEAGGGHAVVTPELRAAVTFEHGNLLDAAALDRPARWDVVFCRNVLMYLTDEAAGAAIARIVRALAPGGYLFLGHAETVRGKTGELALCHSHGTFYYQRLPPPADDGSAGDPGMTGPPGDSGWVEEISAAARRVRELVAGALDRASDEAIADDGALAWRAGSPGAAAPSPPAAGPTAPGDLEAIRGLLVDEQFGEALVRLERLRAIRPDDRDVQMLHALVLTHSGRFTEARTACRELLAIEPTSAGASYLLSLCCDSTGDPGGAMHLAHTAVELDPSFAMARVHLGLLARRAGDPARARRELLRAIELLEREPAARLALFGGGFSRQALLGVCHAELSAIAGGSGGIR